MEQLKKNIITLYDLSKDISKTIQYNKMKEQINKDFQELFILYKIYFLSKDISLSPVTKLINESGLNTDDIIVMFDYDQTLTAKEGIGMTAPLTIRGKEKTLAMINDLNSRNIKWYINTAAGSGSSALGSIAGQMHTRLKIPFSNFKEIDCYKAKSYSFIGTEVKHTEGTTIGLCNNIISAGYNKEIATDYIISKLSSKPKLVIFVDDSASNIMNLYLYFKSRNDINYIGIIYDPLVKAETDHLAAIQSFKDNNIPIIPITEEYTV